MTKVSFFKKITDPKNSEVKSFFELMNQIREGEYRLHVENLREKKQKGASKDEVEKLKRSLPLFTASGLFSERYDEKLIEHSGKLAIDFDKLENIEDAHTLLCADKYTEYLFKSCSGQGLCCIVNIDPEQHLKSFEYLQGYYKSVYGLDMDESCKNVSRARFVSYDPDLFHNPEYEVVYPQFMPIHSDVTSTIDDDYEKLEWCIMTINKKHSFVEGNRHHYIVVLCYFLNKCGVDKEVCTHEVINRFSSQDFNTNEIVSIINHCYKNYHEFGTFEISKKMSDLPEDFSDAIKQIYAIAHSKNEEGILYTENDILHACEKFLLSKLIVTNIFKHVYESNKDAFGIEKKPDIAKVEYYLSKKYSIQKNEITSRIEFKHKGETKFLPVNSDTIYRELQHVGIKFTLDKVKSLLRSDFVPTYNPITNYFSSLPEWDHNQPDYIDHLASYVDTDDNEFWRKQFKKALVRSIACANGDEVNRIIMTLVQEQQETGKTQFIRFLCPPELKAYYTEMSMDGGKDSDMQLSENFIWNLEELAALHNNEINKLKAIISKGTVKQRRAYAEFHESNPRRVNFWASTNKAEFLVDDTNTRWLCFNVNSINHDYSNIKTGKRDVDINMVWAQAYALYKQGFDYRLSSSDALKRDQINKGYEVSSAEKELIMTNFKPSARNKGEFLSSTDLTLRLIQMTDNKIKFNQYAVNRAMRQLDFESGVKKINGKTLRGFWVEQIYRLPHENSSIAAIPGDDEQRYTPSISQGNIPFADDPYAREQFTKHPDDEMPF